MSRPVVTLNDVLEVDLDGHRKFELQFGISLVDVSNDVFIKLNNCNSNIVAYRYRWQSGTIERLFKCDANRTFTVIKADVRDRLAVQLVSDDLVLHRIEDSGLILLSSIKVERKHVQNFSDLRQVANSSSLIYIRSLNAWSLYYIHPCSRNLKHITSLNGVYFDVKLIDGTLIAKSAMTAKSCQLMIDTSRGMIAVDDFSTECDKAWFVPIGSVNELKALDRHLGVDCSTLSLDNTFIELTTLPNLEKIALLYQLLDLKLIVLRNVSGRLCRSIVKQYVEPNGYCRHTGVLYFVQDEQLKSLEAKTLKVCATNKKVEQLEHLWLPRPTYRDVCIKYVPVLESNTNLPSDLCRLVASYLDW